MNRDRLKLVTAIFMVGLSTTSCGAADDVWRAVGQTFKGSPGKVRIPPPSNPQTAQRIQQLIQRTGERAKNAKSLGKTAALKIPFTGSQETYEQSLWEVAQKTIADEIEVYADKMTREQLREITKELASQVVDEVMADVTSQNPDGGTSADQSRSITGTVSGKEGSKNIRSGPGTNYPVKHTVYTGEQITILGKNLDQGGYLWYKIQIPNSGADGWIAAHLVQRN